jgi:hypothetical protein
MRRACRNRGLTFVLRIEESLARERMIANISIYSPRCCG